MNAHNLNPAPEVIDKRRMEIPWAALEIALGDLILDHNQPLQLPKLLSLVHEAGVKRAEFLTDKFSVEYKKTQYQLNALSNLIKSIDFENSPIYIEDRREEISSVIAKMQVVA